MKPARNFSSGVFANRRSVIRSLAGGSLLMPGILSDVFAADGRRADTEDPLAPKPSHFPSKAKRVIMIYLNGGVSHVDAFDPKPKLTQWDGKELPPEPHGKKRGKALRPYWNYKRGKSGIEVSELFPFLRDVSDEMTLIRSMQTDIPNHPEASLAMHTGSFSIPKPSMGSWLSYGLGTMNKNLPSFVVLAPKVPWGGEYTWSSDFLPAIHGGTRVIPGQQPIADLKANALSAELQQMELGLRDAFNKRHLKLRNGDSQLASRIKSYETAFGMQMEAPDAFDLSDETDATLDSYGLQRGRTDKFAWSCVVGRRLLERGVRFVELIDTGAGPVDGFSNWDAHENINGHAKMAFNVDEAIAGLIKDLRQRGMLDDTLVVIATDFGREPWAGGAENIGRGHHGRAFSCWLAGAGVKQGFVHGETDEFGIDVVKDPVHVHDFHATILHLMGMDHTRLTYRHGGRDFRLTDIAGNVVRNVLKNGAV